MATYAETLARARQLLSAGQLPAAEKVYQQLLEAAPQAPEPWHEMGVLQLQAKRPEVALECLQRAVALVPGNLRFQTNLGLAQRAMRQFPEAIASFHRALELGPPSAELYNNLALALKDAGQPDDALRSFDVALQMKPDYANGHFNRANLLMERGQLIEAIDGYRRSLELKPDDAGAYCKLGVTNFDLAQMDRALECFEQALRIQPNFPEVRRNRGLTWLALGQYAKGWAEYEWRHECEGFGRRPGTEPTWDGSPLAGRTLLVYAEQGLGDTLHFIRYVPLLENAGGPVTVEVQPSLRPLLDVSGFDRWLAPPGAAPRCDVRCPLLSLPAMVPDRRGMPYWREPYLRADPELVAAWRPRMQQIEGFKVGVAWAGNPDHPHDAFRSVQLAQFAPLAAVPGVRWISLQKGPSRGQIADAAGAVPLIDLGETLDVATGAFMDTAAVIEHLDLVITVDTSLAHLAGGLGARVWVPLQISPDWRWLLEGRQTAWYPSMTLFRQLQFNEWPPVFEEMATHLRRLMA